MKESNSGKHQIYLNKHRFEIFLKLNIQLYIFSNYLSFSSTKINKSYLAGKYWL